ncbi:CcmD family protein [Chloroflexota bacterium]
MENMGYLFAAFTIIWAVLFGYIAFLSIKQNNLRRDLDLLRDTNKKSQL